MCWLGIYKMLQKQSQYLIKMLNSYLQYLLSQLLGPDVDLER